MARPKGSHSIKSVIAIKKLWSNPEYRKHMSEVHIGKTPQKNIDILIFHAKSKEGRLRMSKRMKGKPAWNKGKKTVQISKKYEDDRKMRVLFRSRMQKDIFKRDNYACQMCGRRGVSLQVDHIQSWKDYVELRFDMNNCRTLCMNCHYFITFGKQKPETIKTWGHNLKQLERVMVN